MKRSKKLSATLWRDPGAVVTDREHRLPVSLDQPDLDGRGGVADGVVDQIPHDSPQLIGVAGDLGR